MMTWNIKKEKEEILASIDLKVKNCLNLRLNFQNNIKIMIILKNKILNKITKLNGLNGKTEVKLKKQKELKFKIWQIKIIIY